MVSFCEIWFKILFILAALGHITVGKSVEICFNNSSKCKIPVTLSCGDQLIQSISVAYQQNGEEVECCDDSSDCDSDFRNICEKRKSCNITNPEILTTLAKLCYERQRPLTSYTIFVYYSCTKDNELRALPASGNPDNTGGGGGFSMVVVPIIVVLAMLIIVAAIFGFVLYRRRRQRKRSHNESNAETNINGEENAGTDDAYNTIPADYGDTRQHHVTEKANAVLEFKTSKYEEIKRGDSVNYCTIVLDEDSKKDNNDYGYDKTNQKKRYEPSKVLFQDNLHSYGHLSNQTDDYNRINSNVSPHLDNTYSHSDSGETSDYSHLNERTQKINNNSENDYNHLQTKSKPIRRVDSYEQPKLKRLYEDQYDIEKTVNPKAIGNGNMNNNGQKKRRDSYEDPININLEHAPDVKNESNETSKPRNDYETPITLQSDTLDTSNDSSSGEIKQRNSCEGSVDISGEIPSVIIDKNLNIRRDDYEAPITLQTDTLN